MRLLKKIRYLIPAILAAALLLCSTTLAADTPTLTVTVGTLPAAGGTFTVTVTISGNTGFNALQYTLGYDESLATCSDMEEGDILSGALSASNPSASAGAIIAAASTKAITANGTVVTYTFTAVKDLSGMSASDLGLTVTGVELSDGNNNISVTVSTPTTGGTSGSGTSGGSTSGGSTSGGSTTGGSTSGSDTSGSSSSGDSSSGGSTSGDTSSGTTSGSSETGTGTASADSSQQSTPVTAAENFTDIASHWGREWILQAAEKGLFKGYSDGTFRPDASVTRAQFVTVLWRLAGKPEVTASAPFTDIANQSAEFRTAITWAWQQGYVNGRTATTFDPTGAVTRQEAMKILFGYSGGQSGMETMFTSQYDAAFEDSSTIASWAKSAMYWGVYNEIISGTGHGLNPEGTATRAQLAKIMLGYLDMTA